MKKLISTTLFMYFIVVFCSNTNSNASMCSSSSISSSPSSAIRSVSLNPTCSNICKLRAAAYTTLVKEVTALIQEIKQTIGLKTTVYLELNNSTKASSTKRPCYATASSSGNFIIHIYPQRYTQYSLVIQKFLLGRLLIRISDYPETLTQPLIDRLRVTQIVATGITQSLTTLPDKANDLAYQQLDQLSLMECPYESVIRILCTAILKGIGLAAHSYAQEKVNDQKKLTIMLDVQSAQISDEHQKGALEYLEHRKKEEITWSKTYLWLQQYLFGYATAEERLQELPERKSA